MKKELKAWRVRIESKNKLAERERQRKEQVLADVNIFLILLLTNQARSRG